MVGGRFNWIFGFGGAGRFRGDVRIVQIDLVAEEMLRAAPTSPWASSPTRRATAEALVEALGGRQLARRADGAWLRGSPRGARPTRRDLAARDGGRDAVPIDPHRLVRELRAPLPRDARIAIDGETIMGIGRADPAQLRRARAASTRAPPAAWAPACPTRSARSSPCPSAPRVALLGDYAFGAAAMEVETAARVGARS